MVQQVLKDDSFVVLGIFCAVEEGGRASDDGLFEESQLHVVFQFGLIARLELGPLYGIVREPFAEFVAGSDFLKPQVHMGLFFGETAGPEAVDENACAVDFRWGFVDAFELQSHGRPSACVG